MRLAEVSEQYDYAVYPNNRYGSLALSVCTSTHATTGLIATSDPWNRIVFNGGHFKPTRGRFGVDEFA